MRLGDVLFVTGTDTDVGKTVVSACLAAAAAEGVAGADARAVRALKPVASGVPEGHPGEDAALLARAAGHEVPHGGVRLRLPASPHRAARAEGVPIDPDAVLSWIGEERGTLTIVEGVGGWEVPITPELRVSAFAQRLGWPVLVVASDRLGALNHTLLTVEAVRSRGLPLAGVVLVAGPGVAGAGPTANLDDLRELLPGVAVRFLPRLPDLERPTLAAAGRALLVG